MVLIVFVLISAATVPLFGGRLAALADVRFRRTGALVAALATQVLIISVLPATDGGVFAALHVATYVMAGWFVVANREVPGVWLVALGGALNLLVISVNGGVMPADPRALAVAGLPAVTEGFTNSMAVAAPRLAFLGDVIAIPEGWPLNNVLSVGDLCLALGVFVGLHRLGRSRLLPSADGELAATLGDRRFRRLWAGQAISNVGDWVYGVGAGVIVAARSGRPRDLALLVALEVAPAAIVGVVGGVLVDRLPRRALLVASDVLRAMALGTLLLVPEPSTAHLFLVAGALGLCRALFQPALHASLPNIVPRERLVAANALVSATYHLAAVAGPLAGAFLVTRFGLHAAVTANAVSFVASAVLLVSVAIPRVSGASGVSAMESLRVGFRFVATHRVIRTVIGVMALGMLAAALRSPLEPLFVLSSIGADAEAIGALAAVWGLGMLVGSVAAPAAARRWSRERVLSASLAVVGAAVLAAAVTSTLSPVLILWPVAGAANALGSVAYETLLQERTPDPLRGRVIASSEAFLDAAFLVGILATGWLGASLGVRGTYVVSGALFVVAAVAGRRLLSRSDADAAPVAATPGVARAAP